MIYNSKTRLGRRFEKQVKKQIFIFIVGIIILLFSIYKYGLTLAGSIIKIFININEKSYSQQIKQNTSDQVIIPPSLDPLNYATNSASIKISGKSVNSNGQIELFLNNSLKAKTEVKKNGGFLFENIQLNEGINTIKVKIKTSENETSDYSKEFNIVYIKKSPDLSISNPADNSIFSKGEQVVTISGKTNTDNRVTINGYWATMQQDGSFNYTLRLNDGDNTIKVESQDLAGNKTTKEIKVKYQP